MNEIERLAGQLRGGQPPEALAMEGKIETNERMTAHLIIQVKRESEVMWHTCTCIIKVSILFVHVHVHVHYAG